MPQLLGTHAALTWVDPTDTTGTERVHLLSVPLRQLVPAYSQTSYWAQSLDRTATQVYSVGTGAHELVGYARYDQSRQSLLDLVRAGALNTTLTYYPNLNDPGVAYAVKLISPVALDQLALQLDQQRGALGDVQIELRFRQTNQAAFAPLYTGSPVLFKYVAGESLTGATFSRAGTATYASKGVGTLTTASSGAARIEWWDLDGDGVRETPTLLLEGASTNLLTQSTNFGAWAAVNTPVLTTGQADPTGGTGATLLADTDAVNQSAITLTPTFTGNAVKSVSVWVKQGTVLAASGSDVQVTDTTATTDRLLGTITWTNGTPSVAMTTGTFIGQERFTNGWWRLKFQTTSVTAANTNVVKLIPAHTASQTGNLLIYGAQAEDSLVATSYIATVGSTVARVRDDCKFTFNARVQTLTCYVRFIALGTVPYRSATGYMLCLGGVGTSTRLAIAQNGGTATFFAQIAGVANAATSSTTASETNGQVVELVATFRVTGLAATAQIQQAIQGVLATATAQSAAAQVSDSVQGTQLGINEAPGSTTLDAFAPYTHVLITRGVVDYYGCRRLAGVQL